MKVYVFSLKIVYKNQNKGCIFTKSKQFSNDKKHRTMTTTIQIENTLANQFEMLIEDNGFRIINITERDFRTSFEIETESFDEENLIEQLALSLS